MVVSKEVLLDRFLNGCCAICNTEFTKNTPVRKERLDEHIITVCDKHPSVGE